MSKYYIWSIEHDAWWKPGRCWYTPDVSEAGKYNKDEAEKICIDANKVEFHEAMIPVESIYPEHKEIKIKPQLPGPIYLKGDG